MPWLHVPHLQQDEPGWCLPACVAMVAAYLEQPLMQADIARWLETQLVGTPASRIQRLERRGFKVTYSTGSQAELESWLAQGVPPILFIRTGALSYWAVDTPHAVVLAGLAGEEATVFDPGIETAPMTVARNELLLAWSFFDYAYAVLEKGE